MNREHTIQRIEEGVLWDVLVVGGGATGLGVAVDAASRGYQTLLAEQDDFCKGTSSRSTKLIHGGVRYLEQGSVSLVRGALRERGLLVRNAPHLVHPLPFVLPVYKTWQLPYFSVGLKLYDLLSGRWSLGKSHRLSRRSVLKRLPTLSGDGLRGGVLYYDAQFDDARLGISLAETAGDHGACLANYLQVTQLVKSAGRVSGAVARDLETDRMHDIHARVVINAAGVFSDGLRRMDQDGAPPLLRPSQGIHVVLDGDFLPATDAMIVPRTEDGRVLFAIPWHGHVLVGTTETPVETLSLEPRPFEQEIEFLLRHLERYFTAPVSRERILSAFAGLRPLVKDGASKSTASLSRDHTLLVSSSGLVTITGGKWTTYRKMASDTVDRAVEVGGLPSRPSRTDQIQLHGWTASAPEGIWRVYGSEAALLEKLVEENPRWAEPLHDRLPYLAVQAIWGVREEMARTIEDVLSRRTRALMLDARAALEAAPKVAGLMASQLGWSQVERDRQLERFQQVAAGYLPGGEE